MNIKRKAVQGVVWAALQRSGTQVVSFIVFIVLSRLLDPEAFGLVAMVAVFISLLNILLDQGFAQALVQRTEVSKAHFDTAFWVTILIGIIFTAGAILGSGLVAWIFHEPKVETLVCWLSASVFLSALSKTQRAILQRELAFDKLAVRTLVAEVSGGLFGVFMAYRGFGVWSLVGRNLTRDFVAMAILWRLSDWRPGWQISRSHFRELFSFGINIIGIHLLDFITRYSDRFLIGYFLGASALGYYTIGIRFIELMRSLFLESIRAVSFPILSRLKNELVRMKAFFYQSTWYASLIAFPIFLGISIVAPEIVFVFFGQKWAPSIPVMRILALIGIAQAVTYLSWSLLLAAGKPSWRLGLTAVNTIANVIFITLASRWGIDAVAGALVFSAYLLLPLTLWAVRKVVTIDLRFYLKQLLPALIGSIGMITIVLVVKELLPDSLITVVKLLIYIISAVVCYGLIIWRLYPSIAGKFLELSQLLAPNRAVEES